MTAGMPPAALIVSVNVNQGLCMPAPTSPTAPAEKATPHETSHRPIPSPADTAADNRAALTKRVIKEGTPPALMTAPSAGPMGNPGQYRVLHGKVCLGHIQTGSGTESVYVHKGGIVELTAEEAGPMMRDKIVEPVDRAV